MIEVSVDLLLHVKKTVINVKHLSYSVLNVIVVITETVKFTLKIDLGICRSYNLGLFNSCNDKNCLTCDQNNCLACKVGYSLAKPDNSNYPGCWKCEISNCISCINSLSICDLCKVGYNVTG